MAIDKRRNKPIEKRDVIKMGDHEKESNYLTNLQSFIAKLNKDYIKE